MPRVNRIVVGVVSAGLLGGSAVVSLAVAAKPLAKRPRSSRSAAATVFMLGVVPCYEVAATSDGGRSWRRIYRTHYPWSVEGILQTGPRSGIVTSSKAIQGDEQGNKHVEHWTADNGKHWHETTSLIWSAGHDRYLFAVGPRDGYLRQVTPWPPRSSQLQLRTVYRPHAPLRFESWASAPAGFVGALHDGRLGQPVFFSFRHGTTRTRTLRYPKESADVGICQVVELHVFGRR